MVYNRNLTSLQGIIKIVEFNYTASLESLHHVSKILYNPICHKGPLKYYINVFILNSKNPHRISKVSEGKEILPSFELKLSVSVYVCVGFVTV